MPAVPITRLDTAPPPLWQGYWERDNPLADDPHTNPNAALQHTTGEDPVNVYTRQRIEGDLFRRDLVLELGLRDVISYLNNRGSITFSVPSVRLPGGDWMSLGRLRPVNGVSRWGYVGCGINIAQMENSSSSSSEESDTPVIQVILKNLDTDAEVFLHTASTLVNPDISTPGFTLDAEDTYDIRLVNPGGLPIVVSAWAIAVPHLDNFDEIYSSESSASSASSASSNSSSSSSSPSSMSSNSSSSSSS